MVCKEDVLSWFKELESYERIDLLYQLLNMCLPWELRFLGTCIEEAGKHTYQELRGPMIAANDLEKLCKDANFSNNSVLDDTVRHRMLLYLSLLSSGNYAVANWLFKSVLRTDRTKDVVHSASVKDEAFQNEFLLLFTMALHHPAFTFDQKLYFSDVLVQLLKLKEAKRRYPPGFMPHKPSVRNRNNIDENSTTVPVKTSLTMTYGDTPLHQHPPGLPQMAPIPHQTHIDYMWSRPGFPCGPPEMPSFPAPAISPLVSRASSPSHSRSSSPHRTPLIRGPLPPIPPMPPLEVTPQPPIEVIPQSSLPVFTSELKLPEDELTAVREEKQLPDTPWMTIVPGDGKHHLNGLRFPNCQNAKLPQPFIMDQMRALSLDAENSLHHSNSSSNSSPNRTPPDTPSITSHHGPPPDRTDSGKPRVNGIPTFVATTGPPMCDSAVPPQPQPFSNCTVPYTTYPLFSTAIPARSIFYNQAYRPPFTAHFPTYATTDTSFPTYSPYVPLVYSSPAFPPRNPNCYNCGATGHMGPDCTGQTIEEITQKKTYTLEFSPPTLPPDADK